MYFELGVKRRKEDFYDREEELGYLLSELRNPITRMIVIKGIRRTGKSSLMRVSLSEAEYPSLLVDMRAGGAFSTDDFHYHLQEGLSSLLRWKGVRKYLERVKEVQIAGVKVELLSRRPSTLGTIIRSLNEWADSQGLYLVLAFDEAQDIRFVRGLTELLAHVYDYEDRIKLLLAGSEVGVLDRLLGRRNPSSPLFGRAYSEIKLGKLPRDKGLDFLVRGFEQAGVRPPLSELEEAVSKLDGLIGWLTYYGYYRLRLSHERALERTLEEGSYLSAQEFMNFLGNRSLARRRYLLIIKLLVNPVRWSEVKRWLLSKVGKVSDKQISNYLNELVEYGFVEKVEGRYRLADPLLAEAVRRGLLS